MLQVLIFICIENVGNEQKVSLAKTQASEWLLDGKQIILQIAVLKVKEFFLCKK